MEFEKLKKVIAEVLNVDTDEIVLETTFMDDQIGRASCRVRV